MHAREHLLEQKEAEAMVYRKADINDIEKLVKIRLAYLNEDCNGLPVELQNSIKEQLPQYYKEHIGTDFIAYIAEEKQDIVSSVFLVVIEKPANPHFLTGKIGEILNVYTKPDYRRQGIAGTLLKQAIEEAKGMNLSYLQLSASKDGYPLYKKLGFTESVSEFVPMRYVL